MPAVFVYVLLSIPLIGAYAMFALGISVIYRASRVLNLAHGAMGMIAAYIAYSLVKAGAPALVGLLGAILSGAALGVSVERLFVRRLRSQGPTAQTVGTVAVTGLFIALAAKIWGTTPLLAPQIFPRGTIKIGVSGIRTGQIGLFLTALVVSTALFAFFSRTGYGLAMRGAAQNRRAASLMGIDPDIAASAAWAVGGALAALAGVLLAAVTNLDPYTLSLQVLPAFVAALIGGLENLRGALFGATVAGLSFGLVPYLAGTPIIGSVTRLSGAPQLALTILALVVMGLRGRRLSGTEGSEGSPAMAGRPFRSSRPRRMRSVLILAGLGALLWPWLVPYSVLGDSLVWVQLALIASSLVVLTGWVGQISLAQASFVGIGALTTGLISRGVGLGFPADMLFAAAGAGMAALGLGVVALRVRGLYLAVATLIFAWMCDTFLFRSPWLGASTGSSTIPAEQIGRPGGIPYFDLTSRRTLFYFFAVVLGLVLFSLANLRDTKTGRAFFAIRGSEIAAASVGIDTARYKLAAFAVAGAIAGIAGSLVMINQRTVVPGQFLFTMSLQFLAIAVVGGLSSLGGALAAAAVFAGLDELFFRVEAISGWLDVTSAVLLATVLLAYPGGLAALPAGLRSVALALRRLRGRKYAGAQDELPLRGAGLAARSAQTSGTGMRLPWIPAKVRARVRRLRPAWSQLAHVRRLIVATNVPYRFGMLRSRKSGPDRSDVVDWLSTALEPAFPEVEVSDGPAGPQQPPTFDGYRKGLSPASATSIIQTSGLVQADETLLSAADVVVRFGGLAAVNQVSLKVETGQIVGLIGPNGAGKTTVFNAILGLNDPADGRIQILGQDITRLPPHLRARLGIARTFQALQLFNELTVFENLLVATHIHNHSGLVSNLAGSSRTLQEELAVRERVRQIVHFLSLDDIAGLPVRGLPFGILRMVELGRALVTGAPLVMLDEPASGLNDVETDKLSHVLRVIRAHGVSVLLIEHDIRMVVNVCDYIYVLDQGQLIAQGVPEEIRRSPQVVAAYLGEPIGV